MDALFHWLNITAGELYGGGASLVVGGYFVYGWFSNHNEEKQEALARKYKHEERMAMIAKGMVPPIDDDDY